MKRKTERKTGLKPSAYAVGDGLYEDAEEALQRRLRISNEAAKDLENMLHDIEQFDAKTRLEIHKLVSDNTRATAALFREARTADRFGADKAGDMDDPRRAVVCVEIFRRLPADLRDQVCKQILDVMAQKESHAGPQKPPSGALRLIPAKPTDPAEG